MQLAATHAAVVSDVPSGPDVAAATLATVVANLSRFPRLTGVGLELASSDVDRSQWRSAFDALPRVQHLLLSMVSPPVNVHVAQSLAAAHAHAIAPPPQLGSAVAELFQELNRLPEIKSLTIRNLCEAPSTLDFTHLPQLPKFRLLSIALPPLSVHSQLTTMEGVVQHHVFRCSPVQAEALGRCRHLQKLRCGVWTPPLFVRPRVNPDEATFFATAADISLMTRSLGALVGGKQKMLSEWCGQRDAAVRQLSCSAEIAALPLQMLCLRGSVVTADVWHFLSQLTQLTELSPMAWAADLDEPAQLKSTSSNEGVSNRSGTTNRATGPTEQSGW